MNEMTKRALGGVAAGFGIAAIVAAILVIGAPTTAQQGGPETTTGSGVTGQAPPAVVLVVDRQAILRQSKAGQDMLRQVEEMGKAMEAEFGSEEKRLREDAAALQQQAAALSPQARQAREAELRRRQEQLQKAVQERQAAIQNGINKARAQIEQALGPILQQIMVERGGNLMLDRSSVILGSVDVDATAAAVQRLDQVLPAVKVEPIAPEAGEGGQGQ